MEPETDADVEWVRQLAGCSLMRAERLLTYARDERRLYQHLAREHAREGRRSYIEIDAPLELYALARSLRPHHIVEVGVSSGVSSAYLLQALAANQRGTLHSVDLPSAPRGPATPARRTTPSWTLPPGRSSGWAVPFALRARWDLRLGDKKVVLPLLGEELSRVGLFVYDVPHRDRDAVGEFLSLDARMGRGSVAIADHGPGGELCTALDDWAQRRGATSVGRQGLGLYGFRIP